MEAEVRHRNVHATRNPDGTWYLTLVRSDGETLVCANADDKLVQWTIEKANAQADFAMRQPESDPLASFLAILFSPTVLTALATMLILGRC